MIEQALADIVAQRYDAGVRLGGQVAKDMIAVRVGPDTRMAVVGSPTYFEKRPRPKKPQDLLAHNCIGLRLPTFGGVYPWEFDQGTRERKVRVEGQLVFNALGMVLNAVLSGSGLACLPEDLVRERITGRKLIRVLEEWCRPFPGYYLYYSSHRHMTAAFSVIVEALRYRGSDLERIYSR